MDRLKVRFRPPQQRRMRSVTVNGKKWTDFDAEREWGVVPGSMKQAEIAVRY